jgi:hypothetical protein
MGKTARPIPLLLLLVQFIRVQSASGGPVELRTNGQQVDV